VRVRSLARGATTVQVMAQSAMHDAMQLQQAGDDEKAQQQWNSARHYDPSAPWPGLWDIRTALPRKAERIPSGISELLYDLTTSWQLQIALAHHTLNWLLFVLKAFIVGVFTALFLKHFSKAIHPYSERFPKAVPAFMRALLVGSLVVSLIAFGAIPFFWVLAFILWPSMALRERVVAGMCLVAIALSPLGTLAESAIRTCRSPDSSPTCFVRALQDGYTPELYEYLSSKADQRKDDYLIQIACALTALKGDSVRTAARWVAAASKTRPDDPLVLTLEGAIAQLAGNHKAALDRFQRCHSQHPFYAPAYFNLGKSLLQHLETLKGADLISQAAELDRPLVETFVQRNDRHFGQNWPRNRQVLIADFPADYFWKQVFPGYTGSAAGAWQDAATLWGVSFLGLPPLTSLLAFLGLLVVLLVRESIVRDSRKSRVKKVLVCELCGAAMCKLCAKGPYCGSCYSTLSAVQIEQRRQAMKVRLFEGARRREAWLASLLDVLFPGSGMLFETKVEHRTVLVFLPLSALLFGAIAAILTQRYVYPLWVTERLFLPLFAVFGVYIAAFLVRGVAKSRHVMAREEN